MGRSSCTSSSSVSTSPLQSSTHSTYQHSVLIRPFIVSFPRERICLLTMVICFLWCTSDVRHYKQQLIEQSVFRLDLRQWHFVLEYIGDEYGRPLCLYAQLYLYLPVEANCSSSPDHASDVAPFIDVGQRQIWDVDVICNSIGISKIMTIGLNALAQERKFHLEQWTLLSDSLKRRSNLQSAYPYRSGYHTQLHLQVHIWLDLLCPQVKTIYCIK